MELLNCRISVNHMKKRIWKRIEIDLKTHIVKQIIEKLGG